MKLKGIVVELPGNPSPDLVLLLRRLLTRAATLYNTESLHDLTIAVLSAGGKLYAKNVHGAVLRVSLCAACKQVPLCGRCADWGADQQGALACCRRQHMIVMLLGSCELHGSVHTYMQGNRSSHGVSSWRPMGHTLRRIRTRPRTKM